MRLFRQKAAGDWVSVVDAVRTELVALTRANNGSGTATCAFHPTQRMSASPKSKSPPSDVFSAVSETRHGIIQHFPQSPAIARSLRLYGEYLEGQINALRRLLGVNDTIVEFAAGCGEHTLALAAIVHHVIAYESDPVTRRVLRQNVRANKLQNVSVLPHNSRKETCSSSTSPSLLTLDGLALSQLGLIKVNDETLGDVIAGAKKTLWRLRPTILSAATQTNRPASYEQLSTFGYRCWHLKTPFFNPDNFNRRRENVFGDQRQAAVLAIPEERDVEVPAACNEI
jgi:hypothetical protein